VISNVSFVARKSGELSGGRLDKSVNVSNESTTRDIPYIGMDYWNEHEISHLLGSRFNSIAKKSGSTIPGLHHPRYQHSITNPHSHRMFT